MNEKERFGIIRGRKEIPREILTHVEFLEGIERRAKKNARWTFFLFSLLTLILFLLFARSLFADGRRDDLSGGASVTGLGRLDLPIYYENQLICDYIEVHSSYARCGVSPEER